LTDNSSDFSGWTVSGVSGRTFNFSLTSITGSGYLDLVVSGIAGSWTGSTGGSWANGNNWANNAIPGLLGDTAYFGTSIGSNTATVTMDGARTLSGLSFSTTGGGSYTLSRSSGDTTSVLTLAATGGASVPVSINGGNQAIAVPVVLGSNMMVSTTAGSSLTISGPISESAVGSSVTLAGSGRVILSASNTYTGGTVVQSGILVAANGSNGSATGSGIVTLDGGTLASDPIAGGSISGEVLPGSGASVIAPGGLGSVGKLTIGSLVTASNLTLDFELTTPGGSNDLLTITNSLTLNPNTAITFGTDPTAYGDYRLISYGSFAGSLSDFDLPGAPPNTMYTLSTTVDPGYIDLVVAVPEPSTLVLLGTAAIGLLGWAWRRRSR
jgi:autotransporter-associated beta strand protein